MPKEEDLPDFTAEEAAMSDKEIESYSGPYKGGVVKASFPPFVEDEEEPEPRQKNPIPASKEEARRSGPDGYNAYHANICQTPGCTLPLKDHTIGQADNHFNKLSQAQANAMFRLHD
jgi:hypothetical protein